MNLLFVCQLSSQTTKAREGINGWCGGREKEGREAGWSLTHNNKKQKTKNKLHDAYAVSTHTAHTAHLQACLTWYPRRVLVVLYCAARWQSQCVMDCEAFFFPPFLSTVCLIERQGERGRKRIPQSMSSLTMPELKRAGIIVATSGCLLDELSLHGAFFLPVCPFLASSFFFLSSLLFLKNK